MKRERAVGYWTGYWNKTNPLRNLCGGRLHRWLALWVLGRERGSTPWPGWPVCRLILARYVPENCSWPSTDRVTTDTITWPARWSSAPLQPWWRKPSSHSLRAGWAAAAFPLRTLSRPSSNWLAPFGKPGAGKLPASPVRSARPPRRKFWRPCWARSCRS